MGSLALARSGKSRILAGFVAGLLAASALTVTTADPADAKRKKGPKVAYWLTVLHNNDGEPQLINAGDDELADFGGVAHFASLVDQLRAENGRGKRRGAGKAAVMLSSGDNFLAGPEFNASLEENAETGDPFYDSIALSLVEYDAMAIGNHEFDFGPDNLAEFIEGLGEVGVRNSGIPPFLSSNLSVDNEPRLDALEEAGVI
ncbi:MAG: hypothetical protein ACRDKZ_07900, partial [Actinomycetota bacterium]